MVNFTAANIQQNIQQAATLPHIYFHKITRTYNINEQQHTAKAHGTRRARSHQTVPSTPLPCGTQPPAMQYVAFRRAICHILHDKRCPFATQKDTFYFSATQVRHDNWLRTLTFIGNISHPLCWDARPARQPNTLYALTQIGH